MMRARESFFAAAEPVGPETSPVDRQPPATDRGEAHKRLFNLLSQRGLDGEVRQVQPMPRRFAGPRAITRNSMQPRFLMQDLFHMSRADTFEF